MAPCRKFDRNPIGKFFFKICSPIEATTKLFKNKSDIHFAIGRANGGKTVSDGMLSKYLSKVDTKLYKEMPDDVFELFENALLWKLRDFSPEQIAVEQKKLKEARAETICQRKTHIKKQKDAASNSIPDDDERMIALKEAAKEILISVGLANTSASEANILFNSPEMKKRPATRMALCVQAIPDLN